MQYMHILKTLDLDNAVSAIESYIQSEVKYIRKTYNYYNGVQAILSRTTTEGRPCNNIVDNRVRPIADSYLGFIDIAGLETSDKFLIDNSTELQSVAKDCVITGVGYTLVNYNEYLRLTRLAPTKAMVFRDNTLAHNVVGGAFWNFYDVVENGFSQEYVDLYLVDDTYMYYFNGKTLRGVTLQEKWRHNIPGVPLIEWRSTSHYDSVIQPGIPLQDLINLTLSSYADSQENNGDPFLVVCGMGIDNESAEGLINGDKKLLNLPLADASASYLQRPSDGNEVTATVESLTSRLYEACNCPEFTSNMKLGSSSGEALKARTISFINSCEQYRKSFDQPLQEIANLVGPFSYEWPSYWDNLEEGLDPISNPIE